MARRKRSHTSSLDEAIRFIAEKRDPEGLSIQFINATKGMCSLFSLIISSYNSCSDIFTMVVDLVVRNNLVVDL